MQQHLGRQARGSSHVTEVDAAAVPASIAPAESIDRPAAAASRPKTWALAFLAVIGAALIIMPLAFNMFNRAPKGATMLSEFKPFMTTTRLDGFQQDIKQINAGVQQANERVAPFLSSASNTGTVNPTRFSVEYPTFAAFSKQWVAIDGQMTNLLNDVQGNLGNYWAVAALPSFRLFPWFFVVPGVLILALLGLYLLQGSWWSTVRWVLFALGIGLILAPAVFEMFDRAPKGGQMMSAFRNIETVSNVQSIQGDFGTMAVGQGAIRLELVPALEKKGLTPTQIQTHFPAVATLDGQWVHILNDMTPMIGAMSDNVTNYQAIAALPPFPLFPYFFVIPGLFVAAAAVAAGPRRRREGQRS
jgi:hypothetical protein